MDRYRRSKEMDGYAQYAQKNRQRRKVKNDCKGPIGTRAYQGGGGAPPPC